MWKVIDRYIKPSSKPQKRKKKEKKKSENGQPS
jgi:hypothetical protein